MRSLFIKYKIQVILVISVIGAMIYFYFKGKKKGIDDTKPNTVIIPGNINPGEIAANKGITAEESERLRQLALAIFDDMDGWNVFTRSEDIYYELMSFSDRLFIAFWNTFNTMFQQDSEQNFYEWLDSEIVSGESFGQFDAIMKRINQLGLY